MVFGETVRAHRRRLGMSQEELARRAGLSVRGLREIESARIAASRPSTVRMLADALGLRGAERQTFCDAGFDVSTEPDPHRPAPADHSRQVTPSQLPPDVPDFTGRADHLARLDRIRAELHGGRAVVITSIAGTAGVGKTALATHWAHRARTEFPDGQLFVDMRGYAPTPPLSPLDALALFLPALGLRAGQVPNDLDQAVSLYRSMMSGRRMLVMLDNANSPEQVRPLLPGSSGCLVMVTSRDRLTGLVAYDGARRLDLDALTPAEARELLTRLLPDRLRAEPRACAELAALCAHLPLALRICAANLADDPSVGIDDYLARIRQDRLGELAVTGDPQAAVRSAFDWSYRTLPEQTARLFRLMGLAPGVDVSVSSAAALAGVAPEVTEGWLERLVRAHLVERHGRGRYTFHDLIREYANELAHRQEAAEEREAAGNRLLSYFLYSVDAAAKPLYGEKLRLPLRPPDPRQPHEIFADHIAASGWLDAERVNLVPAVVRAAAEGPRDLAVLLADGLRGYFALRLHRADWLKVADAGLAAAQAEGDARAQAAAYLNLAEFEIRQNRFTAVGEHFEQAARLARQAGWAEGEATSRSNLGALRSQLGQPEEAIVHMTEALEIDRRTGRLAGQAIQQGNLGHVHWEMGRLTPALRHFTEALDLYRRLGSRGSEALTLANMGEVSHCLGRLDDAARHLRAALALHRETGNPYNEADSLRALAEVHRDAGRYAHAVELADRALIIARDLRGRRVEADLLNTVATIRHCRGECAEAVEAHLESLRVSGPDGRGYTLAQSLIGLADAYTGLGRLDEARTRTDAALALTRRSRHRMLEGLALNALAAVHLGTGETPRALTAGAEALAVHQETGHLLGEARARLLLGDAHHRADAPDRAGPQWERARELFTAIGSPLAGAVPAR